MKTSINPSTFFNGAPIAAHLLSTEELAAALKVRPQTVRAGLCRAGHYLGLKPARLPNGRLLWDATAVDALLTGEVAK